MQLKTPSNKHKLNLRPFGFGGRRGILNIVLENLRNIEYLPEKCTEYGIFQ